MPEVRVANQGEVGQSCSSSLSHLVIATVWHSSTPSRYHSSVTVLSYVLPLMVIGYAYTMVGITLWASEIPGDSSNRYHEQESAKRKVSDCYYPNRKWQQKAVLLSVKYGIREVFKQLLRGYCGVRNLKPANPTSQVTVSLGNDGLHLSKLRVSYKQDWYKCNLWLW